MKLYNMDGSPNALRTRAVAFELGFEPEMINLDMAAGENRNPEFLDINPNGKVPTLVDGDLVIWESRAINAYLAGLRPEGGLYPDDLATRALIDQWSYWQAIHIGPTMQRIGFERVLKKGFGMGEPDEAAIAGDVKTLATLLAILEAQLEGREWITGTLSLADFAMVSTFTTRKPARLGIEAYPNITAWLARIEARPGWQKAYAPWRALMDSRSIPVD